MAARPRTASVVSDLQLSFDFLMEPHEAQEALRVIDATASEHTERAAPVHLDLTDVAPLAPIATKAGPEHRTVEIESPDEIEGDDCSEAEKRECVEFLADHAVEFCEYFLTYNLKILTTRGNPVEKKSVIEWMFAPDQDGHVWDFSESLDGKKVPVVNHRVPFTFQWICRVLGLCQDEIRAGVIHQLRIAARTSTGARSANYREAMEKAVSILEKSS